MANSVISRRAQCNLLFTLAMFVFANAATTAISAKGSQDDLAGADPGGALKTRRTVSAKVHEVQGRGAASPLLDAQVRIEGIVTGEFHVGLGGFFLQEEDVDRDSDDRTSEGIFVSCDGCAVQVVPGDRVVVTGDVTESGGLTALTRAGVVVVGAGNVLPTETIVSSIADTDLEALEGMRVRLAGPLTVVSNYNLRFGELGLSDTGILIQPTQLQAPGPDAFAQLQQNLRSVLLLDDGSSVRNPDPIPYAAGGGPLRSNNTLRAGDTVETLSGVLSFGFGAYRLQPTAPVTINVTNPRPTMQPRVGGSFRIASFNVLNYFTTLDARGADTSAELSRQRARLAHTIAQMDVDVIGLVEVENDLGGVTDAAAVDIVAAVNALAGTDAAAWAFVRTGKIGTDQIKVALIYRVDRVTPTGSFAVLDSSVDGSFDDTKNRPALAQSFETLSGGEVLTVIVNHFKSKGSACPGDPDKLDGQGNCNLTRTAAARAVAKWAATDPTGSGDPDVLVIGDLNAYAKEDPILALERAGYTNLASLFEPHAYSYTFSGQRGTLDYGLASGCLASRATGAATWHINADEPAVLDYNLDNNRDPELFAPTLPFRTSDHDPLVMGFDPAACE